MKKFILIKIPGGHLSTPIENIACIYDSHMNHFVKLINGKEHNIEESTESLHNRIQQEQKNYLREEKIKRINNVE